MTVGAEDDVRIEHVAADGTVTVLKRSTPVLEGEVLDASVMRRKALDAFLKAQVAEAKQQGVLFSVHLKATMMKVSDPIIFGHAVRAVVGDVFDALRRRQPQRRPRQPAQSAHPPRPGTPSIAAIAAGPSIAMVDSDRGITNLHVPSDVIIDASMPAAIRTSGQMWNAAGELAGHQVRHPGRLVRAALRRDRRALPRRTAPSTPPRWARPPTSG